MTKRQQDKKTKRKFNIVMSGQFHTLVMLFIGGETEWALLGNFSLNSMLSLTCIFLGERSRECFVLEAENSDCVPDNLVILTLN